MKSLYSFYQTLPKYLVATAVAVIFHLVGWVGMLFFDTQMMASLTPFNLIITLLTLSYSFPERNKTLYSYFFVAFGVGMITEIIGVNTGYLFGEYRYGENLGFAVSGVPLLIGTNWFVTMYCVTQSVDFLKIPVWAKVGLGALLAVVLDYFLEQLCAKLGFWYWKGDTIPIFNYLCWYLISAFILAINFRFFPLKRNLFGIYLFIIQLLFFMSLSFLL